MNNGRIKNNVPLIPEDTHEHAISTINDIKPIMNAWIRRNIGPEISNAILRVKTKYKESLKGLEITFRMQQVQGNDKVNA